MKLEYANRPVWANDEKTAMDLLIKWDGVRVEYPFAATDSAVEEHGLSKRHKILRKQGLGDVWAI